MEMSGRNRAPRTAFAVLERPASANVEYVQALRATAEYRAQMWASLGVTAPAMFLFIVFTIVVVRAAGGGGLVVLLSVAASLSSTLLHYIAADLHRWNTLTVTTSFLVLYLACRAARDRLDLSTYDRLALVAAPLVLINTVTSIELFDGFTVKNPPFREHLEYLGALVKGETSFPQIPPR